MTVLSWAGERTRRRARIFAASLLACLVAAALVLPATDAWAQGSVVRGPYLQQGTETSIVIRWRTEDPSDSAVSFGVAPGSLTDVVSDPALVTDHEIALMALDPETRYFYAVGTTGEVLAGDDADHFFVTSPAAGTAKRTRLWVIGDSGTAHQQQLDPAQGQIRDAQGVRDSFLAYTGTGVALVTAGEDWKYLDDGSDQGTAWRDPAFDDAVWAAGPSELGYGDDDEATLVHCGPSAPACDSGNFATTYFRKTFQIADASLVRSLTLMLLRDDGAVAYLNGTEVFRINMPAGAIDAGTFASGAIGSTDEHIFHKTDVDPALLVDGANVLAVEVHQAGAGSSDISFNLELYGQLDVGLAGGAPADLWLMLGDNAYGSGTDDEWQRAVFNAYPTLLRNILLWPTLGNHDIQTLDGGPYHDVMTLPTNGEAGGVASGTEQYYAFDYGNIHFVSIDSTHSVSRQPGSDMLLWLAADLAATAQDWVIVYFHHPAYTKGSHDSDSETDLTEVRENILPILEAAGVDLVLAGHSHSYERSFLIDGYYATPTSLFDGILLDGGDGCVTAGCGGPYNKTTPGPNPHEGAVYAVVGSSGKNDPASGDLDHPVMVYSIHDLGSMILDIEGDRLDATVINRDCATLNDPGCVLETFTIVKGAIRSIYLALESGAESLTPGETLPVEIELENITDQSQTFLFRLTLGLPAGQSVTLVDAPLMLGALSAFPIGFGLPLPPGAPLGAWSLTALVAQPGQGVVDSRSIDFTLEP